MTVLRYCYSALLTALDPIDDNHLLEERAADLLVVAEAYLEDHKHEDQTPQYTAVAIAADDLRVALP